MAPELELISPFSPDFDEPENSKGLKILLTQSTMELTVSETVSIALCQIAPCDPADAAKTALSIELTQAETPPGYRLKVRNHLDRSFRLLKTILPNSPASFPIDEVVSEDGCSTLSFLAPHRPPLEVTIARSEDHIMLRNRSDLELTVEVHLPAGGDFHMYPEDRLYLQDGTAPVLTVKNLKIASSDPFDDDDLW